MFMVIFWGNNIGIVHKNICNNTLLHDCQLLFLLSFWGPQFNTYVKVDKAYDRRRLHNKTSLHLHKRTTGEPSCGPPVVFIGLLHPHFLATDNINTGRKFVLQVLHISIALNEHTIGAVHISSGWHCTIYGYSTN